VLPRSAATHPVFDFHIEGAGAGSGAGCSLGLSFLTSQSGSRQQRPRPLRRVPRVARVGERRSFQPLR
jgi:hypothetical protein